MKMENKINSETKFNISKEEYIFNEIEWCLKKAIQNHSEQRFSEPIRLSLLSASLKNVANLVEQLGWIPK